MPASHAYLDPIRAVVHDVFLGVVKSTGPHYCLASIQGNEALHTVRVDSRSFGGDVSVQVGERILLGALAFPPEGPRAQMAWPAPAAPKPACPPPQQSRITAHNQAPSQHVNGRRRGTVTHVAPSATFGNIRIDGATETIWVHVSAFTDGARLRFGERVSFLTGNNGKGPAGKDVRPL
jgi:cold shock CspA family protein